LIEENKDMVYDIIEANCLSKNFTEIRFIVDDECKKVDISDQTYDKGLSASLFVYDSCTNDNWIIIVIVCVCVGAIVIAGIILISIPKTRQMIFPHRFTAKLRQQQKSNIEKKIDSSNTNTSTSFSNGNV